MARLTKRILYAMAIGCTVALLWACAQQEGPTPAPEGTRLAERSAAPSSLPDPASLPSPSPTAETATEPFTHTRSLPDSAPATADLAIGAIPGETGVYTLTIRNLGPDPATGIVLTDLLPGEVIPLWIEPARPVCERQERDVGCDLGALPAGEAATVTLDLSAGGTEALMTGSQAPGVTVTLSVPTCTLDRESSPPQVTCRLSRLAAGAEAQVRLSIGADDRASAALAHTAIVVAHEADPYGSNNRVTSPLAVGVAGPAAVTTLPSAADLVIRADGPETVTAGRPFTYTYSIANQGAAAATEVWFEDAVPSDMNLVAYAPGLPECEQRGDTFTCILGDPDSGETVTLTLALTGHGAQPMLASLDRLRPGWPICTVLKERTWLHIVQCQLGDLEPGQVTRVQLILEAIGVAERRTANTAVVRAKEVGPSPAASTSTVTITVQTGAEPGRP